MPITQDLGGVASVAAITLDADPGAAVKASAGLLFGWHIKNTTGAALYVQVFDLAAVGDVTIGTTAPTFAVGLAASEESHLVLPVGVVFATGIVVFSTTTRNGGTGAASDCTFFYA